MFVKPAYTHMLQAVIVIFCMSVSTIANAQVIVLRSTVATYKIGSRIDPSTNIDVPEGKELVVALPSGAMRTVNGPFNAKADRLTVSAGSFNVALFKAVENYVKLIGLTANSAAALQAGALQQARPHPGTAALPFSWSTLHIRASGDVCLDKNSQPNIARSPSSDVMVLTVVDFATAQKANVRFPAGITELPWPVEIQLKNASYGILTASSRMYVIRIRLIEPIPADENTLQVLHDRRCTQQMQSYLSDLATRAEPVTKQPEEIP